MCTQARCLGIKSISNKVFLIVHGWTGEAASTVRRTLDLEYKKTMTYLYVKVIGELGGSFTFIFVEIGLFFICYQPFEGRKNIFKE